MMKDKVQLFKLRRMNRLLKRMDAEDDEGRWVTTENNHHIHINENGEPDIGNPYVISAMTGKPARVGLSDKQKKIASLLGKGWDSVDPVKEEISGLPTGSMFMVREPGGWRGKTVKIFVKKEDGNFSEYGSDETCDSEDMAINLSAESEVEFDLFEPDEVKSFLSASGGKKTKDLEKMISKHRLYTDGGRADALDDLQKTFEDAPVGTRIELPFDAGRWRKKKKGDSEIWIRSGTKEEITDKGMRDLVDEEALTGYGGFFSGFKYTEPTPEAKGSFSEGHHVFEDKAAGTHEYRGTGKKVVSFFTSKSNCDELISNMESKHIRAFKRWTEGYFMGGQQYKGWDNMSSYEQEYTRSMDEVLDKARLDEPIVVTRLSNASLVLGKGNKQPLLSELRAMKGKKIISKGSMSCAAANEGLTIGARDKMVEYKISVPAGEGMGMWVGDKRINGWGPEQREFVLNRDCQYEVGETTYDSSRGIFQVELKLSRRLEHDYGE